LQLLGVSQRCTITGTVTRRYEESQAFTANALLRDKPSALTYFVVVWRHLNSSGWSSPLIVMNNKMSRGSRLEARLLLAQSLEMLIDTKWCLTAWWFRDKRIGRLCWNNNKALYAHYQTSGLLAYTIWFISTAFQFPIDYSINRLYTRLMQLTTNEVYSVYLKRYKSHIESIINWTTN